MKNKKDQKENRLISGDEGQTLRDLICMCLCSSRAMRLQVCVCMIAEAAAGSMMDEEMSVSLLPVSGLTLP